MSERVEGKVKWFNNEKGFGFILADEYDEDIFVHYSHIAGQADFKTLKDGQSVHCAVESTPKGLRARNVDPLD